MSFVIQIPVDAKDVKVIKEEFSRFVNEAGGFTLAITPNVEEVKISDELSAAMKKMYIQLLVTIDEGHFEEVH